MTEYLSRRQFVKLAYLSALMPFATLLPRSNSKLSQPVEPHPNIILLLFDALTAANLSLYGYPRQTTPNLERFATRAAVYHNHRSAGNFTTPSTASLFTGVYPWTHRAFSLSSLIAKSVLPNNLFKMLQGTYHQAVFTQNLYTDMLLYQFEEFIDHHRALDSDSLAGRTIYNHLFPNDAVAGMKSYDLFLFKREAAHGSLLLSLLNDLEMLLGVRSAVRRSAGDYPAGLPRLANTDVYFSFEQVMDGVMDWLTRLPEPFLAYIHLIPPHAPYQPSRVHLGKFQDGWTPPTKKRHPLAPRLTQERMDGQRQAYDEYVSNADAELGRLFDHLAATGLIDRSYLFITSDHGEAFERGVIGHSTPLVLEPGIRIPLVISKPGQTVREDHRSLTSTVDLLPTLAHIAGKPVPVWGHGSVLPGFAAGDQPDREVFVIEAKRNPARLPLTKATVCLLRDRYKLIHYRGYRYGRDDYEFYDLNADPEEQHDQYASHPAARELKAQLDQALLEADRPYLGG